MRVQFTPPWYLVSFRYWLFRKWSTGFRIFGIEVEFEDTYWVKIVEDTACEVEQDKDELLKIIEEFHNIHSPGS